VLVASSLAETAHHHPQNANCFTFPGRFLQKSGPEGVVQLAGLGIVNAQTWSH
jgi:hypothetical protein